MKGLRIAVVALALLGLAVAGFAQAKDLIMMHDKGGNPNYQPFYEDMGQQVKKAIGIGFTPTPYPTRPCSSPPPGPPCPPSRPRTCSPGGPPTA